MCPGTMAMVALGAKVAGDVISGVSKAQSASYQAQVSRNNATIERQNAAYSAGAAAANTEREGLKARAELSGQRAAFAANNMGVNSGSAADVQVGQRMLGGLDTATVASKGARDVYGYQAKAVGYQAQANLKQAEVVPDYIGTALSVVGDVAGASPGLPSGQANDSWAGGPPASLVESGGGVSSDYQWMAGNPAGDMAGLF